MTTQELIEKLAANSPVFEVLCKGTSLEQWRWKADDKTWSMLEVMHHLLDEERDDFRKRLDLTLHSQGEEWPPIDPVRWAVERKYNRREPELVLSMFHEERSRSIQWLNSLKNPDWSAFYNHPQAGVMNARRILANWLAHDYLHIRQLARLKWLYLSKGVHPLDLSYAGKLL